MRCLLWNHDSLAGHRHEVSESAKIVVAVKETVQVHGVAVHRRSGGLGARGSKHARIGRDLAGVASQRPAVAGAIVFIHPREAV